jgi:hypothetical protein
LPLSHRFVFSHGYCSDCVAHFDERMTAYRRMTVWESLREAGHCLIAGQMGNGGNAPGRSAPLKMYHYTAKKRAESYTKIVEELPQLRR